MGTDDDFMAGYRPDAPTHGFPDGSAVPLGWSPGQTRVQMPVNCCPQCGSVMVAMDDNGRSKAVCWWACKQCLHRFKLPVGPVAKCYSSL